MAYNTFLTQSGTSITLTQSLSDTGADGRSWRILSGSDTYDFYITDDYKIAKVTNAGTPTLSSALSVSATSNITLCIDRNKTFVYIVYYDGSDTYLEIMTISTMAFSGATDTTAGVQPLKALINPAGTKIIWIGSNNTLYRMDFDGSNLESYYDISYVKNTFTITQDGEVYIGCQQQFRKINETWDGVTYYSYGFDTNRNTASFCTDTHVYFLNYRTANGATYIIKMALSDNSFTNVNINSTYSITSTDIKKFYLVNNNGTYEGRLLENNGSDRKILYKVNLTDLTLTSLKVLDLGAGSYDFADTGTVATIGGSGSNGDEGGGQWSTING